MIQNGSTASLELDLEHYVVPAPTTSANSDLVYAANMTETPRSLSRLGVFSRSDGSSGALHSQRDTGVSVDGPDLLVLFFSFSVIYGLYLFKCYEFFLYWCYYTSQVPPLNYITLRAKGY